MSQVNAGFWVQLPCVWSLRSCSSGSRLEYGNPLNLTETKVNQFHLPTTSILITAMRIRFMRSALRRDIVAICEECDTSTWWVDGKKWGANAELALVRALGIKIFYESSASKMNIFVVDEHPIVVTNQMIDKHVVKMILESGQMLSTPRVLDGESGRLLKERIVGSSDGDSQMNERIDLEGIVCESSMYSLGDGESLELPMVGDSCCCSPAVHAEYGRTRESTTHGTCSTGSINLKDRDSRSLHKCWMSTRTKVLRKRTVLTTRAKRVESQWTNADVPNGGPHEYTRGGVVTSDHIWYLIFWVLDTMSLWLTVIVKVNEYLKRIVSS